MLRQKGCVWNVERRGCVGLTQPFVRWSGQSWDGREVSWMGKYWWCPKCKEFPDKIVEHYDHVTEHRIWDGDDTYELVDSDFDGQLTTITCEKCGGECHDLPEGENQK